MASIFAYKSVDTMAWSKDLLRSPKSEAAISAFIEGLARDFSLTHIAVSGVFNSQAEATAEGVSPFGLEPADYCKRFTDAIHAEGLNVFFRLTDCYTEGIYDFPRWVGDDVYPIGEVSDVINNVDRDNWMGRIYNWIVDHPDLFADGDLWGVFPEATGHGIFNSETSFISHGGDGVQANYAAFMIRLVEVSKAAFLEIGKNVRCGFTGQNWSEINSGWLYSTIHAAQGTGRQCFSHYGTGEDDYSPTEMTDDLNAVYNALGQPIFHVEWGDYWSTDYPAYPYNRNQADHEAYLESMYDVWQAFIDAGKLIGFNYWRAIGSHEGIYVNDGDETDPLDWHRTYEGDVLETYFFAVNTPVADVTYEGDQFAPAFELAASSNFADGDPTTAQLTPPAGKTTADFDAGKINETSNPAANVDIDNNGYTEMEWNIIATDGAEDTETYEFRITVNGVPIDDYLQTPEWLIGTGQTVQSIQAKARIVCISIPELVTPANLAVDVENPVYLVWKIPSVCNNSPVHAHVQVDQSSSSFENLEFNLYSFRDSGFEYWNGSAWVAYPTTGVTSEYYGNQARVSRLMTSGNKYWRVRGAIK